MGLKADVYYDNDDGNVYNKHHCRCHNNDGSEVLDEKLIKLRIYHYCAIGAKYHGFENHIYISNKMIRSQSYSHSTPTISAPLLGVKPLAPQCEDTVPSWGQSRM